MGLSSAPWRNGGDVGKPPWEFFAFCTGLSISYQTLSFFCTHLTHFAFSSHPRGFWFADLFATVDFPRWCWPFPKETSCPHPSARSRRWLSAPSPSFPELPRSPSLSPWECWDGCATSTGWRLLGKLPGRQGHIQAPSQPHFLFCYSSHAKYLH